MVLFDSEREKSLFGYGILCGWFLAIVIFLLVCLIKWVNRQCGRIDDEIYEIRIETQKESDDERTSEFLLQEIKENLQSLLEILRPKETRISIP
jgi:hypothetical protein